MSGRGLGLLARRLLLFYLCVRAHSQLQGGDEVGLASRRPIAARRGLHHGLCGRVESLLWRVPVRHTLQRERSRERPRARGRVA